MAHSIEDLTTSCSETSSKNVPLHVDLLPLLSKDEGSKLRRPVRPIDRQRMRPWLMELLDLNNVFGLRWTDRRLGIFQISWRHASRLGWNLETDGDVFERWAKHTGIYKEGDPPEPKRWKANFRCALHSLQDVIDLTIAVERRGRNACRTYRFLQSNDDKNTSRKRAKARRAKEFPENPQPTYSKDGVPVETVDSCTDEEIVSHAEYEAFPQDKVIVQKLDMKPEILVEEFCLHHDHDYAGPDKTHKTIVLRQGVGSIVLHQEIHSAPEAADEVESLLISNLDQLASAAVNSVGIESIQPQEFNDDSGYGKTERSVVEMPELSLSDDSNINRSYFNLKYMSDETNVLGDSAISSNNFTRKRKSVMAGHESFIANVAESDTEAGDVEKDTCSFRIFTNDSPSASLCTRQRTSSPKILCRKPKRSKAGAEKNAPGPSEPLMSSCLLLLEAATRLDNAEKTGVTSLLSRLQAGKQNFKTSPGFQHHEFSSTESQMQNDGTTRPRTSTHELPRSFELQCGTSKSNHTEPNRHVTSFGILRTTLENSDRIAEFKDNVHTFETKHLRESGKSAVNSSEVRVIVNDEPFATGLFSGSKIEPRAPLSFIWNKHDNNKEGMALSKGKVPIQKQADGDCGSASVSGKSMSETQSAVTCNTSAVKPGRVIQKVVIKRVFPVMDTAQKKTFGSECDFSSDISDAAFDDHCSQIYVSAEGASQKLAEINTGVDQIRSVNEFSHSSLSSPSLHRVIEHTSPSSSNDKLCRSDSSKAPLISVLDAHDICFDNSSGTKTYTVTSLPSSLGSVVVSPTPVRTIKFTATSCHPSPMEVLPIYSQAEIKVASKSSDLHLSGCQNVTPVKTDNVIAPSYILPNCPATSTQSSLLLMQDKDVFIIEPRKQVVNDMAFTVVSTSASSSVGHTKLSAEAKNVASAEEHEGRTSQRLLDPGIHEVHHETWPDHSQRECALLKPGFLASTDSREEREETSVSVIMNETTVAVSDIDLPSGVHSEMLANSKSLDSEDVLCELISTSCEKTPLHTPAVYSCSFRTFETEDVTHSGVISQDTSKILLHCSSNKPLQGHSSVSSNYQALGTNRNEDTPLQIKHSFSLPGADKIVNVQSLAQLCKTYVAHLFTTLDNQASESDENDSVTESPQCELKDEKQEMNYLAHAVTLQQKLSSFKSGAMWQDVGSACRHSGSNVTVGIKVPDENTDIAVSPRSIEFQSQSSVTTDTTSTGMMCSGADCLIHVQERSLNSTNSSSLPLTEQESDNSQEPSIASNVGVDTSPPTTAVSSVDTSTPTTAVSSVDTSTPTTAVSSIDTSTPTTAVSSVDTSTPTTAVSSIDTSTPTTAVSSIDTSTPTTVVVSKLSVDTSSPTTVVVSNLSVDTSTPTTVVVSKLSVDT